MEVNSFRLNPQATQRTPEENRALAAAHRLRADAEAARAQAGEERYISTPAEMRSLGDFRHQKLTIMSPQADGVIRGFVQNDENKGIQYQLSRGLAAGMVGGVVGGILQSNNMEIFSRTTVDGDAIVRVESLGVDQATGLMNYTEYQLPR